MQTPINQRQRKPIVSALSNLILRNEPLPVGRRLVSRRMAACTAVARRHPSQGDAKHRPETHRLRDAPQDEVRRGCRYDKNSGNGGLGGRTADGSARAPIFPLVIPGASRSEEPGIHSHGQACFGGNGHAEQNNSGRWLWIPGSTLACRPGMTAEGVTSCLRWDETAPGWLPHWP
jgi:hypothetical protein